MLTPEQKKAREGNFTASEAAILMGDATKATLEALVKRMAWERVHGDPDEARFKSKAMERGDEVEPMALDWYEFTTDLEIERQVHVSHPFIPHVSATPDGFIRGDRVVEAKAPLIQNFMHTMKTREVPAVYRWQVQHQMMCAEVERCDFVSYHPVAEDRSRIIYVARDEEMIRQLRDRIAEAEARVRAWVRLLKGEE